MLNEKVWKLNSHRLSQPAVDDIVVSTKSLFCNKIEMISSTLINTIPNDILRNCGIEMDNIYDDDWFDGLETENLQKKNLKENMGYIDPVMVKRGTVHKLETNVRL